MKTILWLWCSYCWLFRGFTVLWVCLATNPKVWNEQRLINGVTPNGLSNPPNATNLSPAKKNGLWVQNVQKGVFAFGLRYYKSRSKNCLTKNTLLAYYLSIVASCADLHLVICQCRFYCQNEEINICATHRAKTLRFTAFYGISDFNV